MTPCSLVAEYQNVKVKNCLILEGRLSCWQMKGKPSNYTSLVAVACFLPGQAKDLSAPPRTNWTITLSKILVSIMATIISIGILLITTWKNKNVRVISISYVWVRLKWMDSHVNTNIFQWHVTSNNNRLHNPVYLHKGAYSQLTSRHYHVAKISVEW